MVKHFVFAFNSFKFCNIGSSDYDINEKVNGGHNIRSFDKPINRNNRNEIYLKCQYINLRTSVLCGETGPRSAVGNVSGYRCESDCRSRGRQFDPGLVPHFRGD